MDRQEQSGTTVEAPSAHTLLSETVEKIMGLTFQSHARRSQRLVLNDLPSELDGARWRVASSTDMVVEMKKR